jgi:hypothetical protein
LYAYIVVTIDGGNRIVAEGNAVTLTALLDLPGLRQANDVLSVQWYRKDYGTTDYPTTAIQSTTIDPGTTSSDLTDTPEESSYYKIVLVDQVGTACTAEVLVVVMKLSKILFHDSHAIYPDPVDYAPLPYVKNNPALPDDFHWRNSLSNNDFINYPICYTRNTPLLIQTMFELEGIDNINLPIAITVKATITADNYSSVITITGIDSENYISSIVTASQNIVDNIDILETNILWEYSTDNATWKNLKNTQHHIYVTLNDPQMNYTYNYINEFGSTVTETQKIFMTTLHLSCLNAKNLNGNNESFVVNSIYKEFTDQEVKKFNDLQPLKYWGSKIFDNDNNSSTNNEDYLGYRHTMSLLKNGEGRCGAWARFFIDMLCIQGITSARIDNMSRSINYMIPQSELTDVVTMLSSDANSAGLSCGPVTIEYLVSFMLIKNWQIPNADAQFFQGSWTDFDEENFHLVGTFGNSNDVALEGVKAQGNDDPTSIFRDHSIVKYGNAYYDPSYGTHSENGIYVTNSPPFSSISAWEDKNIEAYSCILECPNLGSSIIWVEKLNTINLQDFQEEAINEY